MIEKLIKVNDSDYPYKDEDGVSYESQGSYLRNKLGFCGCGNPEAAFVFLRDMLKLIEQHKGYSKELTKELPTDGSYYFVLYLLEHLGLTEHGGSVSGSWLSKKGEEVLADIELCLKTEKGEEDERQTT